MPIIKSAIKRVRQTAKRRSHNLQVKRAIHADVRVVMDAIDTKDASKAAEAFRAAVSEIDRAVKKGTLHSGTAARQKSRLNAKVKAAFGDATKPSKVTKAKPAAKAPAKKVEKKAAPAKKPAAKKAAAK
jgi:ribosomal protein S20